MEISLIFHLQCFLDAQRWCQVQCEAVEVFEDLPPVTSLPLD